MLRVGADDISLLRAEGLRDITADSLKRQDTSHRPVAEVSIAELAPLAAELGRIRERAPERLLGALINAALLASEKDRELLIKRVEQVVQSLVEDGHYKEPLECYQRLIEAAKADNELNPARTALLVRFKNALTTQWMFDKLMAAIDSDEGNDAAFETVQVMRKAFEARIGMAMSAMTNAGARQRLGGLMTETLPVGTVLSKVKTMDAPAFSEVLKRIGAMKTSDQAALLIEGLHSHDHGVHRLAAGALTPSVVPLLPRGLFATQLNGTDPEVRAKARELAIEMEDPTCAVPLASLLALQRTTLDERRAIYAALVKLASPKITLALVEELERQGDADVRVEIAKAVGAIGDSRAVPGLEAVAAKLLTPAKVKSACKVAAALVRGRPPSA
jgi:hypothetical protein